MNVSETLQPLSETTPSVSEPNDAPVCGSYFLASIYECKSSNCCESYNQRIILLISSLVAFLVALIVLILLVMIEFRPGRFSIRLRKRRTMSEVEVKSNEETMYLRRMSELNPNIRREVVT